MNVAEADFAQKVQPVFDRRDGVEKVKSLVDGHVQNVGNGFALIFDFQRFAIEAFAFADVAGNVNVGQKVHFDFGHAVAFAGFAAAAGNVEGKTPGVVASRLGFRQTGEPVADVGKQAGIGGRIGARGAADRRLVDVNHFVNVFQPGQLVVNAGRFAAAV